MKQKLQEMIDKIIEVNFNNLLYKSIYLYNELFISISSEQEFCLYGVTLKSDTIVVNKYAGDTTSIGKILFVILKKYEKIFLSYLKIKRIGLFNVGKESDFINIFDKEELNFYDIKEKLNFSFLDDYSYRRKIPDHFNIEDSILGIYHSDYECSICNGIKDAFTNFPEYGDVFDLEFFPENNKLERNLLFTNITDYESITIGGNEKIEEILLDEETIKKYDVVSLNQTCISVIMGDDPKSIFKNNNIPQEKTFITNQEIDSNYKTLIKFLMNIRVDKQKKSKNNEILFFGLNKNKNTFEFISFLKDNFDIIVGNVIIPNINKEDIKKILDYNLAVFFNGREVKAQGIFKLYPINQFVSSVPFGITKIKVLTQNILSEMGKEGYIEKLNILLEDYKKINIELYEQSKNFNLGFIIHDFHIQSFLEDNFRGVPILSLLTDMGFNLNFFIYSNNTINSKELEKLSQLGLTVIVSNNTQDLDTFLGGELHCIYSEISNDSRILSKNKEQFSVGDFEYGIDGFYRTFKTLIKKCERQIYKNSILKYYLN